MAQPSLLLRKFGVLIDLGLASGQPLPEGSRTAFTAYMSYTYIEHLHVVHLLDLFMVVTLNY